MFGYLKQIHPVLPVKDVTKAIFHDKTSIKQTALGTKEFAFYDLYGNGLTFYRDI
ncbi:hypothetical protein [Winogradskyella flava]|uniref:Uncharacterized protein n=1 Tax=Winogradskyella flava TaxID=1884876 RepID=A0A842IRY3_9FLAO|nr:hypothetical protein [Winogradskyella flava]MBC2845631.1 hypothetical protein [Winogradskyella flava]